MNPWQWLREMGIRASSLMCVAALGLGIAAGAASYLSMGAYVDAQSLLHVMQRPVPLIVSVRRTRLEEERG